MIQLLTSVVFVIMTQLMIVLKIVQVHGVVMHKMMIVVFVKVITHHVQTVQA